MNRRGADRTSLHERIHGEPPEAHLDPGSKSVTEPPRIRHCWVVDGHGRQPALLLEWRRVVSGWHGRVVRPVLKGMHWVVVEEWLPAELLEAG
jgi:hypothetical protein